VIVFELQNAGTHPLPLYPGIRVAQLLLYELDKTEIPYSSGIDAKYVRDFVTTYGRPWMDWEFDRLRQAIDDPRNP
jgi:deoxycytidine triphosphate deaminase